MIKYFTCVGLQNHSTAAAALRLRGGEAGLGTTATASCYLNHVVDLIIGISNLAIC